MKKRATSKPPSQHRRTTLMMVLFVGLGLLLLRAAWLEVFQQDWLKEKADKRQVRTVTVPPYRGMILDRGGEPIAVSSPVRSVSCNPRKLLHKRQTLLDNYEKSHAVEMESRIAENRYLEFEESLSALARELRIEKSELMKKIKKYSVKHFMYLGRQLEPEIAERIVSLDLPGMDSSLEYRRFYPSSEMFAHVVGFTNIDGKGTEGIERFQDETLGGQKGKNRVVRDGRGKLIEKVEQLELMIPGQDVQLSLDRRIQYIAYKELKKQVYRLKAQAGSVVVLDIHTGEILAMANMPGFNPNNRSALKAWNYRNRAVTDALEMGSTLKPFTIAAALDSGVISVDSKINTSPGFLQFGAYKVSDPGDMGTLSLARILARSSNVGASKIALRMDPREYWMFLSRIGLGRVADSGFKNESQGHLLHYKKWAKVDQAVLSYGYGVSASLLQMAHGYSMFGTGGVLHPVSILKKTQKPESQRVISPEIANSVLAMMETVIVDKRGTGEKALVEGYRVAGKTGTAYKLINKKYRKDKRITSFIGLGPVSNPKIVVAVMLDQPKLDATGGKSAAPVFSKIMAQALRVIDAAPDKYMQETVQNTLQANVNNRSLNKRNLEQEASAL
ncbi:MAG: penicillin-binding protein 2 [Thiotrichaceae bacterium]